jgi:hypothetical protein
MTKIFEEKNLLTFMWQDVENKFDKFQMDTASPGQVRAMQLAAMIKQETFSKDVSLCCDGYKGSDVRSIYKKSGSIHCYVNLLHSKMAEIFPTVVMALNSVSC